ncbi:uroporphyrin-III C-methyltransferase/precorrin-2 dehydrogenase/sirohydrochlorin ferrochelatase [Rhizobium leguminosarum]|uniref:Uroporphyrin-III C-methyltransferase/precorrin-2 dehydrogenase/sirohydrochlorin ferrochelatase n=1 Tax=Rhizobium leguminosarum TaxID=384 RepID=A0AAE2MK79_RHILE|nr:MULTISPECIES: siroheme synthase CysG [Rhizobium]MBB4290479.1 uroporphyrin-III C-methyltransferase/precorrin-2 dehydrogenase/sirohydrochlorin ferrochelatase [Rhizobium leguminosarum]MBB4297121.1 uroporphyrin-III C-methyltransferase/precorrin-2 dehydrogenase/sirohydrochlorin ferrochelatase [Rhizobium leguminosarum]MBB4307616.1 uroporphyrin-III C-methyltransferase/precorrin-2 dehydrogenase/sirohydrochlorin ferrochelatase [Rhizobium leguminosarum]MBB4415453.1 uroporphyrin-III C-methyltransferase
MPSRSEQLSVFPAFFRVEGQKTAVFGNGDEAFAKVRLLFNTRARIVAYADRPEADYHAFLIANRIETVRTAFSAEQVEGAALVFAATGDDADDRDIVDAARTARIPANAVDQPDYCDFFTPALVNRAPVAVAIGTEGAGPVLAQMIRAQIDQLLSPSLGRLAALATSYRKAVEQMVPRGVSRRVFWRRFFSGAVADAVANGNLTQAQHAADRLLQAVDKVAGHVWLVGAGPGAEDLLTLRAQRVMMEADVIVYDALVPQAIVDMGRRDAERLSVGKRKGCHSKSQEEINDLLVDLGRQGKRVVRLKSGDPLVYGRAGEEMAALRAAGITYEVVPGITSAFAAAADFELPLTLRGVASSLVFTTGHDLTGDVLPDWASLAVSGATIAVYMGRTVAASVAERLMQAGIPAETTVAVIENASRAERRLLHGTLADLPDLQHRDELTGPVMVIIGDAVAGANFELSEPLVRANARLEELARS